MAVEIPGYKILRTLGRGGMATVYLAIQEVFEREVALKVMSRALAEDPNFAQRFFREAKIVSKLVHPHIVTVHDVGVHDGYCYLSMEYIDGQDLRYVCASLSVREKIQAIRDIAKALDYAGAKGYVHRDIKPENIMFHSSDGRAVLMDFGIARAAESDTMVTQAGTAIGTPHYMSPEQAKGKNVDGRSDIYSLGVVFFYIFAGRVPYDAESAVAVGIKHITEPVPLLPPEYEALQPLVDRMMAKDVAQRYQNAKELMADLDMLDLDVLEHGIEFARHSLIQPSATLAERTTLHSGEQRRVSTGAAELDPFESYVAESHTLVHDRVPILSWMVAGSFVLAVLLMFVYLKYPEQVQPYLGRLMALTETREATPEAPPQVAVSLPQREPETSVEVQTNAAPAVAQGVIVRESAVLQAAPSAEQREAEQRAAVEAQRLKIDDLTVQYQRDPMYLVPLAEAYRELLKLGDNTASVRMEYDAFRQQELKTLREYADSTGSSAALTKRVEQLRSVFTEEKASVFEEILDVGTRRKKVMTLLLEADAYVKQNNLTKPDNRNALDTYRKVLALDDGNVQARAGIQAIAQKIAEIAQAREKAGDPEAATENAERALELDNKNALALQIKKTSGALVERRSTVDGLLKSAERKIARGDLFSPSSQGAFHDYQRVLQLEPQNQHAQAGLERVVDALSAKVWQLVGAQQFAQARELMRAPLREFGSNPRIQSLSAAIDEVIGGQSRTVEPRIDGMFVRARPVDNAYAATIRHLDVKRTIVLDFDYRDFRAQANVVQAVLLERGSHSMIVQVPVVLEGERGRRSLQLERPLEGIPEGEYTVEIRQGGHTLNSMLFAVK